MILNPVKKMTGFLILCLPRRAFLCYNCVKVERELANQTISVHRKKYAVGLFWQPLPTGNGGRSYARYLARSLDGHYNLYTEYKFMIGLSMRHTGQKSGMPSAAAEVCEAMSEFSSFLAVFVVENGFYMVAVRNGIIISDRIFNKESDAREEYTTLSQMPDWGAFIAPAAWGMPRAVEHTLYDVITGHSHTSLRSLSMTRSIIVSVLLVLLFVLLMVIIYREPVVQSVSNQHNLEKIDTEQAAEYRRQIDAKNKELDEQFQIEKKPEAKPIVPPYELLPDVAARADIRYRAIGFLMQQVPGWNQTSAECGETHVFATFKRSFGTLDDFYAVAADIMPGVFVQEISDDQILVRAKLPERVTRPSQDVRDADSVVRDLTSRFQAINMDANISVVVDAVANDTQSTEIYVVEVAAESKMVPSQFMLIFDDFGGVYMTKAAWNVARKMWNYEVIIYAK